jgi:hypothetical protein
MTDLTSLLQSAIHWLYLLPPLAGAAFCLTRLGESKWAPLLAGVFLVQAALSLFYRLTTLFGWYGGMYQYVFLLTSLVGLLAELAIVAGIAGLFWDLAAAAEARRAAARSGNRDDLGV